MKMKLMKLAVVLCVVSLFSIAAMAQGSASATLSGVVKDPKNAVVANATVVATNADRGIERSTFVIDRGARLREGRAPLKPFLPPPRPTRCRTIR